MSNTPSLVQVEVKSPYPLRGRIITARYTVGHAGNHIGSNHEHFVVAFEQAGYWAVVDRRNARPAVLVETEAAALAMVEQLANGVPA